MSGLGRGLCSGWWVSASGRSQGQGVQGVGGSPTMTTHTWLLVRPDVVVLDLETWVNEPVGFSDMVEQLLTSQPVVFQQQTQWHNALTPQSQQGICQVEKQSLWRRKRRLSETDAFKTRNFFPHPFVCLVDLVFQQGWQSSSAFLSTHWCCLLQSYHCKMVRGQNAQFKEKTLLQTTLGCDSWRYLQRLGVSPLEGSMQREKFCGLFEVRSSYVSLLLLNRDTTCPQCSWSHKIRTSSGLNQYNWNRLIGSCQNWNCCAGSPYVR